MPKLYMTKGLPASGKSTWAREQLAKNERAVRINNDDLRRMLHNGVWSKENEKIITQFRNLLITEAMQKGLDIIIDNTNLAPRHEEFYRNMATRSFYEFELVDFTHVPLNVCIERDQNRQYYVGERVIRKMYLQFIRKEPGKYTPTEGLPNCIIVDIDGTLAINRHRNPYDYTKVYDDDVNYPVLDIVHNQELLNPKDNIFIFSGRDDSCYEETRIWLIRKCRLHNFTLVMRKTGDRRHDWEVKEDMYNEYIRGKYNVDFVLDDRMQVVDLLWRRLGLPTFQVNEGEF